MFVELLLLRTLTLFFVAAIFAQAFILRARLGTWLSPAGVFALYWGLMTAIPFLLVTDAAPVAGEFIILLMVSAFSLGSVVVPLVHIERKPQRFGLYDSKFLYISLIVAALTALVFLIINSSIQGFGIDRIFTLDAAAEYTESRYSGNLVTNIFLQLSTVLSYVAAAISGMLMANARRSRIFVVFLGLAPTLFVLVTQSAKGALLLSMALIAAGHFVRAIDENESRIISVRSTRRLIFYTLMIMPLIIVSFLARGLYGTTSVSEQNFQIYRYVLSYTSGHLLAFDDWVRYYFGFNSTIVYYSSDAIPGFYTFMSIARAIGDNTFVPMGTYDEYFSHSDYLQTNVYTMFRGMIYDFSLIGSLVFMMFSGIVAQLSFRGMLGRMYNPIAVVGFIVFVAIAQQSAYISLFQYNSPFIFGFAIYIILVVNYGLWRKRHYAVPRHGMPRAVSDRSAPL